MKFLSFDIECCDGNHICEFGYVLFDEEFKVIEKECIPINPKFPFRLSRYGEKPEVTLFYSEQEYKNSPEFPIVADRIRKTIGSADVIVGFSMRNDYLFLKKACERYNLLPIEFAYNDMQRLYRAHTRGKNELSLQHFLDEVGIDTAQLRMHRSDDDSYGVMLAIKKMCEESGKGVLALIGELKTEQKTFSAEKKREKEEKRMRKEQTRQE